MKQSTYSAVPKDLYTGRDDGLGPERIYQKVVAINLIEKTLQNALEPSVAFLGYACDEGVTRNHGRKGAKQGPNAIRKALSNLAVHSDYHLFDVGNVTCEAGKLEMSQAYIAKLVSSLLRHHYKPMVFGGGHETAWGHYLGLFDYQPDLKLGIINFDAHFDMRPLLADGVGSSGTPFLQICQQRRQRNLNFDYLCLGIQDGANTETLFATAKKNNVEYVKASDIHNKNTVLVLENFISRVDKIYLTYCLDAMAEAIAPGVSAPQVLGLWPNQVLPLLQLILASQKVMSVDIVELAPCYDSNDKTAKLAAALVNFILTHWQ